METKRIQTITRSTVVLVIICAISLCVNIFTISNDMAVKRSSVSIVYSNLVNIHLVLEDASSVLSDHARNGKEESSQASESKRLLEEQCAQIDIEIDRLIDLFDANYRRSLKFESMGEAMESAIESGSVNEIDAIKEDLDILLAKLSTGSKLSYTEHGLIVEKPNYWMSSKQFVNAIEVFLTLRETNSPQQSAFANHTV